MLLTSHVVLQLDPCETSRICSTKNPSSRSAPTPRGYEPGTPFIDESPCLLPTITAGLDTGTATPTAASPRQRSFQHAFTRTRYTLGPSARGYSPFAPRPHEVHRLLQSKLSVSAPRYGPNFGTYTAASRCRSKSAARKNDTHRAVIGQGPRAFRSRFRRPSRRPLVSMDLPQPDRPGHPLSRTRTSCAVEAAHEAPMR